MSDETPRHEMTKKRVVYEAPGMDRVNVRRNIPIRTGEEAALTFDLYTPPDPRDSAPVPAVVFVSGFADAGVQKMLGCRFKEMEPYISWAQLVAISGMAAIAYTTSHDPAADLRALLRYVREDGASLGIDAARIGLWACSGHGPNAISALIHERTLACAALCYPFTLDLDGSRAIADAARTFGFANPCAGRSVEDLPSDVPLFIARAGRDEYAGLNDAIDRFAARALARNLPITLVNHPTGPHAFDLMDDSDMSRGIVRGVLAFLRLHLERTRSA